MDTRAWFTQAADGFRTLLPGLDGQLDKPGLGDWAVRSLLGHTCRAFSTIETYLNNTNDTAAEVEVDSPEEYFRAAAAQLADPEKVTRRGCEAGTALGKHPLYRPQKPPNALNGSFNEPRTMLSWAHR